LNIKFDSCFALREVGIIALLAWRTQRALISSF
jgi:hypothetical protein